MDEPEEQSLDYPVKMIPVGMKQRCMKHLDMSERVAGATTHLFVNYCNCQTVVEAGASETLCIDCHHKSHKPVNVCGRMRTRASESI